MKKFFLFVGFFAIVFALYISIFNQKGNWAYNDIQEQRVALFIQDLDDNSVGEQVAILQTLLKVDRTLYTGPVSGFYTRGTKDAVVRFQKKHLISPTGTVDLNTRLKLNEIVNGDKNIYEAILKLQKTGRVWGTAQKVEGTRYGWTMVIENDITMGTAEEIVEELNTYRIEKGKEVLKSSQSLTNFAQMRASFLNDNGGVDEHRGFKEYIRNPNNRSALGYTRYGENTSCGYRMTAAHMIRWIFAGDEPHEANQLNDRWKYVGVGVSGTCVSLVFAH